MITVENLTLYFGAQTIFENISFTVTEKDKIGLVGKNGSGKSTLLNVLSQKISPNEGKVTHLSKIKLGFLQQDLDFKDECSLLEEMKKVFTNIENYKSQIKIINSQIKQRNDYKSDSYLSLLNKLSHFEELLRMEGSHDLDLKINNVLMGLGFKKDEFNKHTSEFSGGWRMRVELAKILLQNPDVLLLDEPTNHLDIISIVWLEKWLSEYKGAVILVSHDKNFLDSIINRTIEISFSKINNYKSNYGRYLFLRKERKEKQIQAKKNQDKYIEQTKILINKFRAKKNKAAFAQTLIKKLSKLELIEVDEDDVGKMNLKFPPAPHSGKVTFKMKNISKSYNSNLVLENINLEINKGEKIAFVGKNGEGKSTLAKIIVNEIEYEGMTHYGYNVKYGYYAQNQSDFLDGEKSVLQSVEDSITGEINIKARDILGSFLFTKDDVDKKVSVLSGGERARVALCKLLLSPINFLIMDEPTNHLDMYSIDILKKALLNFDGTLIIISHDRSFLNGLTNKVFEFKDKSIKEYIGGIDFFLETNNLSRLSELDQFTKLQKNIDKKRNSAQKIAYLTRKENEREIRKLKNKISKLELEIAFIENKKKKLDTDLSDPEKFRQITKEKDFYLNYDKEQKKLLSKEKEWERLVSILNEKEKEN
ncbi:MAG: ABC-F family ATP-binding cassette domain-containing protein [Bacteroidota bacterium]|nr:ABC-F family ATP-binding cassette domain-containing protein [Bacteroidota bacterium]